MDEERLIQLVRAFQESRAILTALELDVFTAVADGRSGEEVARRLGTDRRGTEALLNALVALELLTKAGGRFANTPLAERLRSDGGDETRAALLHQATLWRTWSTLTDCVRAGSPVAHREMRERDEDWTGPFIAAMHRNAAARAPVLLEVVGVAGVRRLLDVGGGSGAYAIAFAQASPQLRAEILDLETVVPIARRHIDAAGLAGRVTTRVGDLRRDAFGEGYDLVLLAAICHMLGPEENRSLFRRCFDALAPGGRLVVQDFILEADKTRPKGAALFALNMLVGTPHGSTYSEDEYRQWLGESGFADVRRVPVPAPAGLMIAARAG